ncbi:lytic murein transglycosylase [Parvularcula marina]|uniref:Lytic murein transglycosylase n=1 Tax=Parvularcula marina TaxID=2292771 RepID=A0A371RK69_9PROT|nr:lytic murein transglycosylase [Parvularcula marina]RFB05827.1 lytic murein transglycosylase [Parvularcula marina]
MTKRAIGIWAALLAGISGASAQEIDQAKYDAFITSFKAEAMAKGISAEVYDREMASAKPMQIVVDRNNNQPEFAQAIWTYLDSAVSDRRISDGLNNTAARAAILDKVEAKYGVDKEIIGAIWGLESSYGAILGSHDVISALSTLAYDGRRQSFGKSQLIGALTIIQDGYARRDQLKGSWAGAMGQTQFIPTTYLAFAIDENGDGLKDLWADHEDVFASTANYLAKSGYKADQPWGFEVTLPDGFDYSQASLRTEKTVSSWHQLGVALPTGSLADKADFNASASVIVPAGANGPAFMVLDNFRAIMKYNNSTSYALGIGRLSDAIAGRGQPLSAEWPRDDRPLSLSERKMLQEVLTAKGYNPGPVDGIIGAGTQAAIRQWQKDQGVAADGYASAKTLAAMQAG